MFNRRAGKLRDSGQIISPIYLVPNLVNKGDVVKVFWEHMDDDVNSGWWYYAKSPEELEKAIDCEILDGKPKEEKSNSFWNLFKL